VKTSTLTIDHVPIGDLRAVLWAPHCQTLRGNRAPWPPEGAAIKSKLKVINGQSRGKAACALPD
jgi:hypothetical protein